MNTTQNQAPVVNVNVEPTFAGKYRHLSKEVYTDSKDMLKLTREQAKKLADIVASEYGEAVKLAEAGEDKRVSEKSKFGVSSTNKKGDVTLAIAVSTKISKVEATPALEIMHALGWMNQAMKHNVSRLETGWLLKRDLRAWMVRHLDLTPNQPNYIDEKTAME